MLPFLPQLFFTQLLVGLIQQVRGGAEGAGQPWGGWGWPGPAADLTLRPPLQWMVPTIQNSMKPFKVSCQALH